MSKEYLGYLVFGLIFAFIWQAIKNNMLKSELEDYRKREHKRLSTQVEYDRQFGAGAYARDHGGNGNKRYNG